MKEGMSQFAESQSQTDVGNDSNEQNKNVVPMFPNDERLGGEIKKYQRGISEIESTILDEDREFYEKLQKIDKEPIKKYVFDKLTELNDKFEDLIEQLSIVSEQEDHLREKRGRNEEWKKNVSTKIDKLMTENISKTSELSAEKDPKKKSKLEKKIREIWKEVYHFQSVLSSRVVDELAEITEEIHPLKEAIEEIKKEIKSVLSKRNSYKGFLGDKDLFSIDEQDENWKLISNQQEEFDELSKTSTELTPWIEERESSPHYWDVKNEASNEEYSRFLSSGKTNDFGQSPIDKETLEEIRENSEIKKILDQIERLRKIRDGRISRLEKQKEHLRQESKKLNDLVE